MSGTSGKNPNKPREGEHDYTGNLGFKCSNCSCKQYESSGASPCRCRHSCCDHKKDILVTNPQSPLYGKIMKDKVCEQ